MFKYRSVAVVFLLALVAPGTVLLGDDDEDERSPEAAYRHEVMEAVGSHMGAIVAIVRKEVPHTSHLSAHASAISSLADLSADIFAEGSQGGDALAAIWEKPDDFNEHLAAFRTSAKAFADAVNGDDRSEIEGRLKKLGQSCRGCHRAYRRK